MLEIRGREFIALLDGAAAWPLAVRAKFKRYQAHRHKRPLYYARSVGGSIDLLDWMRMEQVGR
jgi:hypothetical protein